MKKYKAIDLIEMMWMNPPFEERVKKGWHDVYKRLKMGLRTKDLDFWADVIIKEDEKRQEEADFKDLVMGKDDDDDNPPF